MPIFFPDICVHLSFSTELYSTFVPNNTTDCSEQCKYIYDILPQYTVSFPRIIKLTLTSCGKSLAFRPTSYKNSTPAINTFYCRNAILSFQPCRSQNTIKIGLNLPFHSTLLLYKVSI